MPNVSRPIRGALCAAIVAALALRDASAVTIVVDDASDRTDATGCTLRSALGAINFPSLPPAPACSAAATGTFGQNDTIRFATGLTNSVISLKQGQLSILRAVAIEGSDQTIDAGGAPSAMGAYCNCAFRASRLRLVNAAPRFGSAALVIAYHTVAQLDDVTVANNTGDNAWSAGIDVGQAQATLNRVSVLNNTNTVGTGYTPAAGGGIGVSHGTLEIRNSTIAGNRVISAGGARHLAGGIDAEYSTLRAVDTSITSNTADAGAAAASFSGGAVQANNSDVTLANVTVSNNLANAPDQAAGGILFIAHRDAYAFDMRQATIAGNTAETPGAGAGGVVFTARYSTVVAFPATIANSIVSQNAGATPDIAFERGTGGSVSTDWNLFGTAAQPVVAGSHVLFSDTPGLLDLGANGGPTKTMALAPSSPALAAGNRALAVYDGMSLRYDQRGVGFPRTFGNSVDLGAYQNPGDRIFADFFETGP